MIVAAGASERETGENRTHGVGNVIQDFLTSLQQVSGIALVRIVAIECRGQSGIEITGPKLIARNLLTDETVIRLVLIERTDHIVAVTPDVGASFVGLEALALGVARQVQPVPGPSLAIVRRLQEPIDYPFVSSGR